MLYQIQRNGQTYGPYTLEDLQRYLASGNVLSTDLCKSDDMPDWVPVSQVLNTQPANPAPQFSTPGYANPGYSTPVYASPDPAYSPLANPSALAASPYPDPPSLHWGLVLLFALLTCSIFMWVWNIIVAAWLKRVQPNATSLFYYVGAAVLTVIQFGFVLPFTSHHAFAPGVHVAGGAFGGLFGIITWVVRLVARFMQRASLEQHFNGPEPIGLRLDPVMTFFFGGLYFQYHLTRISQIKQTARYGAARAY